LDTNIYRPMSASEPGPGRRVTALYRASVALTLAVLILYALNQPQKKPSITLAFLGDVMLGRGVAASHPGGDWATALATLRLDLGSADLVLANLESPLTDSPSVVPPGGYDLRASPSAVQALVSAPIDVLSLANNHRLDGGPAGFEDTLDVLHLNGLQPLAPGGAWNTTVQGVKLSFLAYDCTSTAFDVDKAKQDIALARSTGSFVIVSLHWGGEYRAAPEPGQVALAQTLVDAGAGMIWGHHPHVLQPLAWVDGVGPPGRALVAYSLGNALFDQPAPPDASRGAVLLVTLDQQGIRSVRAAPFEIDTHSGRTKSASPRSVDVICRRLGEIACQ
jgi:poly-gamma-glutamate capsule biosynthesis protein CapA/YwtB (metallophosphatase superfamily)